MWVREESEKVLCFKKEKTKEEKREGESESERNNKITDYTRKERGQWCEGPMIRRHVTQSAERGL